MGDWYRADVLLPVDWRLPFAGQALALFPGGSGSGLGVVASALGAQSNALILIDKIFRMHVRHIEEHLTFAPELQIESARDRTLGNLQRQRVTRECLARTAKHIAGKLIEKNDQRQRAFVEGPGG